MDDDNGFDVISRERPLLSSEPTRRQQQEKEEKKKDNVKKPEELRKRKQKQRVSKPREQLVSECRDHINMICEKCDRDGSGKRPLNIVIVGKQGCGKSSFINSLAASLSQDYWIEYAMTGFQDGARPITDYIHQYPKCGNADRQQYQDVLLPTLIDIPGMLEDTVDERMENFLQLLFYGHVENLTAASEVFTDCEKPWEELLETYSTLYEDMKVDRVIFVASANSEQLPTRLIKCVMNAARPPPNSHGRRRQIPVYGVLTNCDKVDDETKEEQFEKIKLEFKKGLGLHEGRLLCCSNYCDDTDPDKERFKSVFPSLDLPILEFFVQVCERKVTTTHHGDRMQVNAISQLRNNWRRMGSTWQSIATSLVLAFVAFVLMYVVHAIFFSSEQDFMLLQRCQAGDSSVRELCKLSRSASSFGAATAAAVIAVISYFFYSLYLNRRENS